MRTLILLLLLAAVACAEVKTEEATVETFELSNYWIRPASSGNNTAAYIYIENGLSEADTLISATTLLSDDVQIHESYMTDDGLAAMQEIGTVIIPAKSDVTLEPGGKHIMMLRINSDATIGDSIAVELTFTRQGKKELVFPVRVNQ